MARRLDGIVPFLVGIAGYTPMTLEIRGARNEDTDIISDWLNDARVNMYLSSNLREGRMKPGLVRAALRRPDQNWNLFSVDAQPSGIVVLDQIDKVDGLANCWYALGDGKLLGQGHTTAAIRMVIEQTTFPLHVITAWAGAANKASQRCLEKAGFKVSGTTTGAMVVDGARMDRILYEKVIAAC